MDRNDSGRNDGHDAITPGREPVHVHSAYPLGELAKAFTTALTHHDRRVRARAEDRVDRWRKVLAGMADGTLAVGSRTPVAALPGWVTPQVVRGGFATGTPAASGPLLPHETQVAHQAGLPAERRALFAHALTTTGLADLTDLLRSGAYAVDLPEEAALLTVAWLADQGETAAALELLDILEPFADRLRFLPRPVPAPPSGPDGAIVFRWTVGEVRGRLQERRPRADVDAMNEALAVWNPFADELLDHWLTTVRNGRVLARAPKQAWLRHAAALLERYRTLAAEHTRCGKHRRPKENAFILRTAMEELVRGRDLDARRRGMVQNTVDAMVRRRGAPGTPEHTALRSRQAADAARPTHHAMAQLVTGRLADLPPDTGTPQAGTFTVPVTPAEHEATSLPTGADVPEAIARLVRRSLAADVPTLIGAGIVPSAEVLAALVPQLVATASAAAYPDPELRRLMTAVYGAFRNRRSLLLVDLQHQVRFEELPWVRAVEQHRRTTDPVRATAARTLADLGELALHGWAGTVLPNPLVSELATLARTAGLMLPWTEELAADIFMGTFTPKFPAAAEAAAELLDGTLYAAYYGIDYANLAGIDEATPHSRGHRDAPRFAALCHERAGVDRTTWLSVAQAGAVIEQAQILTTHNLALLAGPVGVTPPSGWAPLARSAFATTCRLAARIHGNPRPLTTIKDMAYAWRQALFYLSLATPDAQAATLARFDDDATRCPGHARARLAPVLAGLHLVREGGALAPTGSPANGGEYADSSAGHLRAATGSRPRATFWRRVRGGRRARPWRPPGACSGW
ncbi:hypothetical protein [Actinacidiphila rubida]|uniref:Uncharacterized protein n=1 Tax=Actinacidiphila rubida TaxID=310780 RepID=A0A1H8K5L3_9ACTN|nr:hypothetical protein [Actinacidiphila rubida]SEN88253.1 hypothetical protein SAMN05216267_10129 [Actinacidiphila rubida]